MCYLSWLAKGQREWRRRLPTPGKSRRADAGRDTKYATLSSKEALHSDAAVTRERRGRNVIRVGLQRRRERVGGTRCLVRTPGMPLPGSDKIQASWGFSSSEVFSCVLRASRCH